MRVARTAFLGIAVLVFFGTAAGVARAAKVTVDLGKAEGITAVGAFDRWDEDGNARKLLDGKEKLDIPLVAFKAANAGDGKWVFKSLPPGKYDLVIMGDGRRRIEGFTFPPVLEYDPFSPSPTSPTTTRRSGFSTTSATRSTTRTRSSPCTTAATTRRSAS